MRKTLYFTLFLSLLLFIQSIQALKIDRVILASDAEPFYLDFWPLAAKAWKRMGIQPTLALIADETVQVDKTLGDVIRFDPIPGIPISLQAQTIRLLLSIFFPDDVCIISDIDMLPLSKEYFVDQVKHIPDNAFVTYNNKAYGSKGKRFPMCYNAAKGEVFQKVFDARTKDDIVRLLKYWHTLNFGWSTDERILYMYVNAWNEQAHRLIKLNNKVEKRISRKLNYEIEKVKAEFYIDVHCPRPYKEHKESIDTLAQHANIIE